MDLWFRYTGDLEILDSSTNLQAKIDGYTTMDVRLAWRPTEQLELSLVGQNLFDEDRLEYLSEMFTYPTKVPRSFYGNLTFRF